MPRMGRDAMMELARALLTKTNSDELEWTQVEGEATSYETALPSGIVRVRSMDRDGQLPAQLVIYGPEGGPALDSINSSSPGLLGAPGEPAVGVLYYTVRRRVLGVDSVIAGMLGDLGETKQTGGDEDIPF